MSQVQSVSSGIPTQIHINGYSILARRFSDIGQALIFASNQPYETGIMEGFDGELIVASIRKCHLMARVGWEFADRC